MTTRRIALRALIGTFITLSCGSAGLQAASLTESFDSGIPALVGNPATGQTVALASGNWFFINRSTVLGTIPSVFTGATNYIPAHQGANYVAFDYRMTAGANTISAWLITPELSFTAGDSISFFTRGLVSTYPDRLEVRYSTAGASTDVGSAATDVGVFTTLLGSINPDLTVGGYPTTYTQFTYTIASTAVGRIGLRYFVTNSGPAGVNGDYIGIDTFAITPIPEPSAAATLAGLAALGLLGARRRHARLSLG